MRRFAALIGLIAVVTLAACGGDDPATSSASTVSIAPAESAPAADPSTAPVETAPTPIAPVAADWQRVDAPAGCMCADGSPYAYFVREADPTKVLFYLEGGGACFGAEMCAPGSDTYKQVVGYDGGLGAAPGIFDVANDANPFRDYSIVFVPYCTGDVHSGNLTKDYGNGVVIEHKGLVNGTTALDDMIARFPDASTVVVAGSSAGAFPTPIYAGLAADRLANATIKVVADSGGAIPDAMSFVVGNWGTLESLPDWPEFAGVTLDQFTPAYTFSATAKRHPQIAFARHDYAYDRVLSGYAVMAGLAPDDLVSVMKTSEAAIEETGSAVATWIGPGDAHTILASDELYVEEMNGVRFLDWLVAFLDGSPQPDQYCTDCAD